MTQWSCGRLDHAYSKYNAGWNVHWIYYGTGVFALVYTLYLNCQLLAVFKWLEKLMFQIQSWYAEIDFYKSYLQFFLPVFKQSWQYTIFDHIHLYLTSILFSLGIC